MNLYRWNKKESKMKEYEVVHEIFNECANNQMRDVDRDQFNLPVIKREK